MVEFNKIFGIGLFKTGKHSLTKALNILGIKALQNWKKAGEDISALFEQYEINDINVLKAPCLKQYDAFIPGVTRLNSLLILHKVYKQLDKEYPNSKFILTIRDLDSWLIDTEKHIKRNQRDPDYKGKMLIFEKNKYIKLWKVHHQDVLDYFKNRPNDLLVMNICAGDGWEKLCPFLGMPMQEVPFPHENSTIKQEIKAMKKNGGTL